ncbi:hypothetical protein D920_00243 [Enterococcus faecalis 13-SD-W-01]|nr:hypothetical protein D920_00243 [Enterococcus faecalis 13-SD-W-01]
MNRQLNKNYFFIKLCILSFFLLAAETVYRLPVFAEASAPFSIRSLKEDGEVNEQGYYFFEGNPNEEETITIEVMNNINEPLTIGVEAIPAQTNQNGITSFLSKENLDETLEFPFNTLVENAKETIELGAGETKKYTTKINYPTKEWGGEILGGFRFSQENTAQSQQVTHKFAYTIGVLMRQKGIEVPVNELNARNAKMSQRNYRNVIEINLQNKKPVSIRTMEIDAKVYYEDENEPTIHYKKENLRMAPNSNFDFGIPTFSQPIRAGNYRVELTVKADTETYHFVKKFHVDASSANSLNNTALDVELPTPWLLYSAVGIGIILIFLILYLLLKNKIKGGGSRDNSQIVTKGN